MKRKCFLGVSRTQYLQVRITLQYIFSELPVGWEIQLFPKLNNDQRNLLKTAMSVNFADRLCD